MYRMAQTLFDIPPEKVSDLRRLEVKRKDEMNTVQWTEVNEI